MGRRNGSSHRYRAVACVHRAGELAAMDAFLSGMLPVTVVEVVSPGVGWQVAGPDTGEISVRVNVTRGGYQRGEVVSCKACDIVPRDHLYQRDHSVRINTQYRWE